MPSLERLTSKLEPAKQDAARNRAPLRYQVPSLAIRQALDRFCFHIHKVTEQSPGLCALSNWMVPNVVGPKGGETPHFMTGEGMATPALSPGTGGTEALCPWFYARDKNMRS